MYKLKIKDGLPVIVHDSEIEQDKFFFLAATDADNCHAGDYELTEAMSLGEILTGYAEDPRCLGIDVDGRRINFSSGHSNAVKPNTPKRVVGSVVGSALRFRFR